MSVVSPSSQRSDVPAIDIHAHIIPPKAVAAEGGQPWHGLTVTRRPDGRLQIADRPHGHIVDGVPLSENVDTRLQYMDEAGVDIQVLSLTPSLWLHGLAGHDATQAAIETNDELIELASAHPSRFRAFAYLPLDRPAVAVSELERAMASPYIMGAAVATHVNGQNWDEPALYPILEAAHALGAALFFHPESTRLQPYMPRYQLHNLVGNPAETTVAVASIILGGVLDRLPGLRLVFAHGGGYAAFGAGRIDHGHSARRASQIGLGSLPSDYLRAMYFDNLVHSDSALRYLLDVVGPTQVVMGTDYPADMGSRDPVNAVLSSDLLSSDEKRGILSRNLSGLMNLEAPVSSSGH